MQTANAIINSGQYEEALASYEAALKLFTNMDNQVSTAVRDFYLWHTESSPTIVCSVSFSVSSCSFLFSYELVNVCCMLRYDGSERHNSMGLESATTTLP